MKNLFLIFSIALMTGFTACNPDVDTNIAAEKSVAEIKSEGIIKNSDIIRNPVTVNEPIDSINVAEITFEEHSYEFGTVNEGDVVEHVFKFTNTGKVPLVISKAKSTCGCTVPTSPKKPIAVGASDEIKVRFNTRNKKNKQRKPVTVTANTWPKETVVYISGFVTPKEGDDKKESADGHDHGGDHSGHNH